MAVASHDFTVAVVNVADGVVEHQLDTDTGTVLDLAFTPDGRYLVAVTEGAAIRVWHTADFRVASRLDRTARWVHGDCDAPRWRDNGGMSSSQTCRVGRRRDDR